MQNRSKRNAAEDRFLVDITHTDPVIYREPFVMSFEFIRVDLEILEFSCTIEAANYDHRL